MSGNTLECTASTSTGGSAGLYFLYVGGLGRFFGNCPEAALIAAWISPAAPSELRDKSNCTVIWVVPSTLVEVICDTPGICENWYSNGCATEEAIVSGFAPGRLAVTWIVGRSTWGNGATGNIGYATRPTSSTPNISKDVAIGRLMNGVEILILHRPSLQPGFLAATGTGWR